MDEVAGYLPPTANPPSKKPIMLLLKQARAFGVGVVLSTQNPVDVDYKALSNAGTWLIGRLQTEQDKARLIDGLKNAAGSVDISAVSETISGLGKRQFMLKKVGSDQPSLTTTRWAMSYLRGPLMRSEITRLGESGLVATREAPAAPGVPVAPTPTTAAPTAAAPSAAPVAAVPSSSPAPALGDDETPVAPTVAAGIPMSYLDPAAGWAATIGAVSGVHVRPAVVARVMLRFDDTKADLLHDEEYEAVLFPVSPLPNGADFVAVDYDDRDLLDEPPGPLAYGLTKAEIGKKTWWTTLAKTLTDHLVRTQTVEVLTNPELKAFSRVGETAEQFRVRCTDIADDKADVAIAALQKKYETKLRALRTRAQTAASASSQAAARHEAEHGTTVQVTTLLGGLFGGRRSRSSITTEMKRSSASEVRVQAAYDKATAAEQAIADVEAELAAEVAEIDATWAAAAGNVQTLAIPLERTDIAVTDLRLVWIPVA
jgi:hypothetical protein